MQGWVHVYWPNRRQFRTTFDSPAWSTARHVLIEPIRFIADCGERTKRQFAGVALDEPIFRRTGSSGSGEQLRTSERCGQIARAKKCERAAHQRYLVRILCIHA